ncbi:MAG: hypothetical protein K5697_03900 [Lachnospiraceae bacterium]|nr:hypothetical protein [Lachnospiraceae bacterium]
MVAVSDAKMSALLEASAVIRNEVDAMKSSLIRIRDAVKNTDGLPMNPEILPGMEMLIDGQIKTDLQKLESYAELMEKTYKGFNTPEVYGPPMDENETIEKLII